MILIVVDLQHSLVNARRTKTSFNGLPPQCSWPVPSSPLELGSIWLFKLTEHVQVYRIASLVNCPRSVIPVGCAWHAVSFRDRIEVVE